MKLQNPAYLIPCVGDISQLSGPEGRKNRGTHSSKFLNELEKKVSKTGVHAEQHSLYLSFIAAKLDRMERHLSRIAEPELTPEEAEHIMKLREAQELARRKMR